jgi:hypothetical protein
MRWGHRHVLRWTPLLALLLLLRALIRIRNPQAAAASSWC